MLLLTGEDAVDDIQRVTRSNMVDGVLLLDVVEDDDRVAQVGSYDKPCVAIGYPADRGDCACVDIDFAAAGALAMDYLYERGHRDVLLLRDNERDYERRSGYVVALRRHMLDRAHELGMRIVESGKNEAGHFDAAAFVRDLKAMNPRPTAIVNQAEAAVMNMVVQELADAGIGVPNDVSLLSVGTFFENDLVRRPITEIPVMPKLLCAKAVGLLLSAVEDGRRISASGELVPPVVQDHGTVATVIPSGASDSDATGPLPPHISPRKSQA